MVTRFEAGDLDEAEEEDGGGSGGTGVRGGGELAPRMAEEARARRKTREAATGSILSEAAEESELEFGSYDTNESRQLKFEGTGLDE